VRDPQKQVSTDARPTSSVRKRAGEAGSLQELVIELLDQGVLRGQHFMPDRNERFAAASCSVIVSGYLWPAAKGVAHSTVRVSAPAQPLSRAQANLDKLREDLDRALDRMVALSRHSSNARKAGDPVSAFYRRKMISMSNM